ncbi:hypothetical protein TELCIR_14464 [Teladorsagia circumcincta]|uniref:Uncharacterized protein n=1 Tax=Teladorsagia circumcincta TaxID=45464 RepID=A0A2G9U108_TELCI|nr:hypothetical protein TELCIR_14464 [Teladorsagia circumcincta]
MVGTLVKHHCLCGAFHVQAGARILSVMYLVASSANLLNSLGFISGYPGSPLTSLIAFIIAFALTYGVFAERRYFIIPFLLLKFLLFKTFFRMQALWEMVFFDYYVFLKEREEAFLNDSQNSAQYSPIPAQEKSIDLKAAHANIPEEKCEKTEFQNNSSVDLEWKRRSGIGEEVPCDPRGAEHIEVNRDFHYHRVDQMVLKGNRRPELCRLICLLLIVRIEVSTTRNRFENMEHREKRATQIALSSTHCSMLAIQASGAE